MDEFGLFLLLCAVISVVIGFIILLIGLFQGENGKLKSWGLKVMLTGFFLLIGGFTLCSLS